MRQTELFNLEVNEWVLYGIDELIETSTEFKSLLLDENTTKSEIMTTFLCSIIGDMRQLTSDIMDSHRDELTPIQVEQIHEACKRFILP